MAGLVENAMEAVSHAPTPLKTSTHPVTHENVHIGAPALKARCSLQPRAQALGHGMQERLSPEGTVQMASDTHTASPLAGLNGYSVITQGFSARYRARFHPGLVYVALSALNVWSFSEQFDLYCFRSVSGMWFSPCLNCPVISVPS